MWNHCCCKTGTLSLSSLGTQVTQRMSVCDHSPRCTLPHSFSFLRPEASPFCSPISINKSNFAHRETQRLLAVHGRAQSLVVRVCNTHRRGCPPPPCFFLFVLSFKNTYPYHLLMLSTTMTLSGALFLSFFKLQACSLFTAKSSKVLLLSIHSKTRCDVCYCHSWFSLMEVTPQT